MRARRILLSFVAIGFAALVAGAACGASSAPPSKRSRADGLRRPLHLPTIAKGEPCPVSKGVKARTLSKDFGSAQALGSGPVYPVVDVRGPNRVVAARPVAGHAGFVTYKVLWITAPRYTNATLIRGRRLDGRGGLWFGFSGRVPVAEQRLPSGGDGRAWKGFPSQSYVKSNGCYGYQLDGIGFSRVVVVRIAGA